MPPFMRIALLGQTGSQAVQTEQVEALISRAMEIFLEREGKGDQAATKAPWRMEASPRSACAIASRRDFRSSRRM